MSRCKRFARQPAGHLARLRSAAHARSRPCRLHPKTIADFAPALIAAKPVKPCDGGVFGAFYLLLLLQQNRRCPRATGRLGAGSETSLRRHCGLRPALPCMRDAPASSLPSSPSHCPRSANHRFFAPDLIAAKPQKPCDGGVFRAFYLLLFLERAGRCPRCCVFSARAERARPALSWRVAARWGGRGCIGRRGRWLPSGAAGRSFPAG